MGNDRAGEGAVGRGQLGRGKAGPHRSARGVEKVSRETGELGSLKGAGRLEGLHALLGVDLAGGGDCG